jgi:hypothetical protein
MRHLPKTPNKNSSPMVITAEMSSEPRQPNRFEKKKNNLQPPVASHANRRCGLAAFLAACLPTIWPLIGSSISF